MRIEKMEFGFMSKDGTKLAPNEEGKKCQK